MAINSYARLCSVFLLFTTFHVQCLFLKSTLQTTEENQLTRMKRGIGEAYIDDEYVLVCCDKLQNVSKLTTQEIKIMGECQDEVENKMGARDEKVPVKEYFLNYSTCGNQCLFEKHGWIDEEGNIREGSAAEIATTQMGVTNGKLLEFISTICPKVAQDYKENHNENYVCNRTAMMFYTCSFDMMNLHCPKEHLICNEGCDRRMEKLKNKYGSHLLSEGGLTLLTL